MRLVKVKTPAGKGAEVAQMALGLGIKEVSVYQERVYRANEPEISTDAVNVSTSTPTAKVFIETLMVAPFFDPGSYAISVRQPRTIVSEEHPVKLTVPIVLPTVDILEDLWLFSHITLSFVIRVVIAGLLLTYGMFQSNLLIMIAGLLFLPFLPLLLAIGFGLWTREWQLLRQGALTLAVGILLVVLGGSIVALLTSSPLKFQQFGSLLPSVAISCGVGVAAALATADDGGRRELIGLAATAQIGLVPAWFGISLIRGFTATTQTGSPTDRLLSFGLNLLILIGSSAITYALMGMNGEAVRRFVHGGAGHDK